MDCSRHHPLASERFGLSRLAEVAGVDVHKIQRWQFRGAMKVRRVGKGQDRSYRIWDALRVVIIAETSMLGLPTLARAPACRWPSWATYSIASPATAI